MNSSSNKIITSKFVSIFVELCTFLKKVTQFYQNFLIIPLPHRISNSANIFSDIEKNQINISRVPPISPNIDWYDQNLILL